MKNTSGTNIDLTVPETRLDEIMEQSRPIGLTGTTLTGECRTHVHLFQRKLLVRSTSRQLWPHSEIRLHIDRADDAYHYKLAMSPVEASREVIYIPSSFRLSSTTLTRLPHSLLTIHHLIRSTRRTLTRSL